MPAPASRMRVTPKRAMRLPVTKDGANMPKTMVAYPSTPLATAAMKAGWRAMTASFRPPCPGAGAAGRGIDSRDSSRIDSAALEGRLGGIGGGEAVILRHRLEAAHQRVADAEGDEALAEDGDAGDGAAGAADERSQDEAGAAPQSRHHERRRDGRARGHHRDERERQGGEQLVGRQHGADQPAQRHLDRGRREIKRLAERQDDDVEPRALAHAPLLSRGGDAVERLWLTPPQPTIRSIASRSNPLGADREAVGRVVPAGGEGPHRAHNKYQPTIYAAALNSANIRRSRRKARSARGERARRLGEPARRLVIDKRRQLGAHARVIGIEPGDLAGIEQRRLDQVAVDRRQRDGLEAQHLALAAAAPERRHHDEVLDADAVRAGLVVAGLVRDDHARQERLRVGQLRDALRPLMDGEIAADAVAGAVVVVEPDLPQRAARQRVELRAGGALGEAAGGERDVALEHAGEAVAHLRRRLADRHRARDVGGAVEILRAGIDEIERARLEPALALGRGAVMHDGAVGPGAGDGGKAQIAEIVARGAERREAIGGGDLGEPALGRARREPDRKSTRLNSSHGYISYAVFCLKKKKTKTNPILLKKIKKTYR